MGTTSAFPAHLTVLRYNPPMRLVKDRGPAPLKRFGQNFLADPRLAAWLVDRFAPGPGQRVVEIGPGTGMMTAILAASGTRLIALELDERLIPALEEKLAPFPAAEVRHQDALAVDWNRLAEEAGGPLRIIGNLPYNVGTAIIRAILATDAFVDLQVVLQLEVGDRLLAEPGCKDFGPLSVIASLRTRRQRLRKLLPGSFRPAPKVTSCALALTRLPEPHLAAAEVPALEELLFAGFAQRRKTLAANFPRQKALVQEFLREHDLAADSRAEQLPAPLWPALARHLKTTNPSGRL